LNKAVITDEAVKMRCTGEKLFGDGRAEQALSHYFTEPACGPKKSVVAR
jgi:hypothetical protein